MFKRSKSKVLVDYASEEDEMAWHHKHTYKDEDPGPEEEEERPASPITKDIKVKKIKSRKERRDRKLFSSQDDEHFLLTGVTTATSRGTGKKNKEDEKERNGRLPPEKGPCFWDSVTMTMRQITPTRKLDRMEGWEPPCLGETPEPPEGAEAQPQTGDSPASLTQPPGLPPWTSLGLEEDSSRYANLEESPTTHWTARAKGKLAGMRRSRGHVTESSWEGLN